ncbi:hypothetical protein PMAYCL1PPCAC_03028, partial [Pristionchus mayeri]
LHSLPHLSSTRTGLLPFLTFSLTRTTRSSDPSTMFRMANFFISKNLAKAEKMPNYRQWKVSESDRSVEGPILLYIRSKGWFFDRVCQPGIRHCVLTKRGFLLIYMRDEKGFVLDIRRAYQIKSISDNVTVNKNHYRRCRIKIRYSFGTVNIILTNGKIDLWRDALLNATSAPLTRAITNQLVLPRSDSVIAATTPVRPTSSMYGPLDDVEVSPSLVALKSFSTAAISDKEASHNENWAKVKTPLRSEQSDSCMTCVDLSTCDDDYQCLSSRMPQIDEEEPGVETSTSGLFNYNSIRESTIPVGWLRRQLEHKIVSERRRPIYVAPPATPLPEADASTSSESSSIPILKMEVELPYLPLEKMNQTTVSKAAKSKKHVKFSTKHKSPMKATAKSVPSDSSSCENTRFNSFQFWRSSIFESDV